MSRTNTRISIYANLPSGGAKQTYKTTLKYLSKKYSIHLLKEPKYQINNIFSYLYISLIKSPSSQYQLASKNISKITLCYQSWLVNSPSILRYLNTPVIYICHETPREYYDKDYIKIHSFKEKIINIIRIPIKYLDLYNVKASNITIIANSKLSKENIDNVYGVNSIVVYPGINVKKYRLTNINKLNQVITIGSINKLKQQIFIVEVISNIPVQIRPKFVIIANGCDKRYLYELERFAQANNVDLKIKMNISESEKISELNKSIVFIYAPLNEPFGLVVEEAIAAGLPILVYSKGGGYAEVISKTNGVIVNNLNISEWSKHLIQILKNTTVMHKFKINNYKYALKNFSDTAMNRTIEKIILSKL